MGPRREWLRPFCKPLSFQTGRVCSAASNNAALMWIQLGDDERGIKEPEKVARRAPGSIDMRAALAAVHWSRGEEDIAEQYWSFACTKINSGQVQQGGRVQKGDRTAHAPVVAYGVHAVFDFVLGQVGVAVLARHGVARLLLLLDLSLHRGALLAVRQNLARRYGHQRILQQRLASALRQERVHRLCESKNQNRDKGQAKSRTPPISPFVSLGPAQHISAIVYPDPFLVEGGSLPV